MKTLILLLSTLLVSTSFAQNLNAQWMPTQSTKNRHINNYIGSIGDRHLFIQKYKENNFQFHNLVCINPMNNQYGNTLIMPTMVKDAVGKEMVGFVAGETNPFVIIEHYEHKVSRSIWIHQFDYQDIGGADAECKDPGKELYKFECLKGTNLGRFYMSYSPSREKASILIEHPTEKKAPTSTFGIVLLDGSEMSESKTLTLDIPSKKLNQFWHSVDEKGNVLLKAKYKKDKEWYNDYFFCAKGSDKFVKIELDLGASSSLSHLVIHSTPVGSGIIGSFIDKSKLDIQNSGWGVNGIIYIPIENGALGTAQITKMSDEILLAHNNVQTLTDRNSLMKGGAIMGIHTFSNGDNVVLIESRSMSKKNVTPPTQPGQTPGKMVFEYTYQYDNITAICLEKGTANIKWATTTYKSQKEVNRIGNIDKISAMSTVKNDKLYIIYNNVQLKGKQEWTDENGANLIFTSSAGQYAPIFMQTIASDGSVVSGSAKRGVYQKSLFPAGMNANMFLRRAPRMIMPNGDLGVFGYTGSRSSYAFGILGLE